jgi:hypothetical protein
MEIMQDTEGKEMDAPKLQSESYQYIELREGKWRFKGRRANIIDAVLGLSERGDTIGALAQDLSLPEAAIEEAISFLQKNPEVISEHHRRMLKIANEHSRR